VSKKVHVSKAGSAVKSVNTDANNYDVVISGGGVVGCLMALALATQTTFKVLLLEANSASTKAMPISSYANDNKPRFDARVIALASESLNLLSALGVNIDKIAHQAIAQIHVSDKGHMGQVRLHANDYNISALGKVLAIDALGDYLLAQVNTHSEQITYLSPIKIEQVTQCAENATITLSNNAQVVTRLLIVSDGGQSETASLLGMKSQAKDYDQSAVITNIKTQVAHNNIAYERFTKQGPIAFLPMNISDSANIIQQQNQHNMSIVWCMDSHNVDAVLALNDDEFLKELTGLFGHKLGKLEYCSKRYSYPLSLVQKVPFVLNRAVAVGNAAQTLHPIAGQGFNLGIRDVEALVNVIKGCQDPGNFELLNSYKRNRQKDKQATIGVTDTLLSVFSNQHLPLVVGRNLALMAMNKNKQLKKHFAHFAMGLRKTHD
jgi:2-octaprenyl-6-methoxyphenol hydroxylase